MTLVNKREDKDARTSQELAPIEVYAPNSDNLVSARQILVRKGQHLDVDGILARSLLNPRAISGPDVKTIVSR